MKKTFLRFVSTALAVFMLLGSVNVGVFAADFADEQDNVAGLAETIKVSVAIESATLATLVANELSAPEKAVLNHTAVKTAVTEIFAGDVDGYVSVTLGDASTIVKAESIKSAIGTWTPVSVEAAGQTVNMIEGTAIILSAVEAIKVNYSLEIAEGSEAYELATLPSVLAAEAKAQKVALDVYASMINELKSFDVKAFDLEGMKGILQTQAGKDAIDMLLEKCVAEDGKTLLLYTYLLGYVNEGLAYY